MKIPMLMTGGQIAGLIFGLIFGVIIFGFACWWLHFVYTWMNSMSSSNSRIAKAMERIADKYAGKEEKKKYSGEAMPSQTGILKPRPETKPTSETGGGYRKEEPPEDLENQSDTVRMYWRMKMASERQEDGKKDRK